MMRGALATMAAAVLVTVTMVEPTPSASSQDLGPALTSASAHLSAILDRSPAPQYRRFGSAGMATAADYAEAVLAGAGFDVIRHGGTGTVFTVDYDSGHEPLLERLSDGATFRTESALFIESPTTPAGITCTVRAVGDVTPGDCGFVPFASVSPEWKNPFVGATAAVDDILAAGGVGVVLQGDVERDAVIAVKVRRPIAAVVAAVDESEIVGEPVRLRSMGAAHEATLQNVVAVREPADSSSGYIVLQAHLDGFFEAAVDNGTGAAAVLAAAERLAATETTRGLLIALYDGEEWGLLGSEALFADLASPEGLRVGTCGPEVHAEDLVAVLNLDASSAIPSDVTGPLEERLGSDVPLFSWRAMVFSEEPLLASLFIEEMAANQVLGAPLPVGVANPVNGGMTRTDGRWFHEAGIPVAWPVAGYPEYHTSADDIDAVDPVDLEHVTDGAVAVVVAADTAPIGRIGGSLGPPGSIEPTPPASCPTATPTAPAATDGDALPVTGRRGGAPVAVALLAIIVAVAVRRITCED
jgi:hypothetical protein